MLILSHNLEHLKNANSVPGHNEITAICIIDHVYFTDVHDPVYYANYSFMCNVGFAYAVVMCSICRYTSLKNSAVVF